MRLAAAAAALYRAGGRRGRCRLTAVAYPRHQPSPLHQPLSAVALSFLKRHSSEVAFRDQKTRRRFFRSASPLDMENISKQLKDVDTQDATHVVQMCATIREVTKGCYLSDEEQAKLSEFMSPVWDHLCDDLESPLLADPRALSTIVWVSGKLEYNGDCGWVERGIARGLESGLKDFHEDLLGVLFSGLAMLRCPLDTELIEKVRRHCLTLLEAAEDKTPMLLVLAWLFVYLRRSGLPVDGSLVRLVATQAMRPLLEGDDTASMVALLSNLVKIKYRPPNHDLLEVLQAGWPRHTANIERGGVSVLCWALGQWYAGQRQRHLVQEWLEELLAPGIESQFEGFDLHSLRMITRGLRCLQWSPAGLVPAVEAAFLRILDDAVAEAVADGGDVRGAWAQTMSKILDSMATAPLKEFQGPLERMLSRVVERGFDGFGQPGLSAVALAARRMCYLAEHPDFWPRYAAACRQVEVPEGSARSGAKGLASFNTPILLAILKAMPAGLAQTPTSGPFVDEIVQELMSRTDYGTADNHVTHLLSILDRLQSEALKDPHFSQWYQKQCATCGFERVYPLDLLEALRANQKGWMGPEYSCAVIREATKRGFQYFDEDVLKDFCICVQQSLYKGGLKLDSDLRTAYIVSLTRALLRGGLLRIKSVDLVLMSLHLQGAWMGLRKYQQVLAHPAHAAMVDFGVTLVDELEERLARGHRLWRITDASSASLLCRQFSKLRIRPLPRVRAELMEKMGQDAPTRELTPLMRDLMSLQVRMVVNDVPSTVVEGIVIRNVLAAQKLGLLGEKGADAIASSAFPQIRRCLRSQHGASTPKNQAAVAQLARVIGSSDQMFQLAVREELLHVLPRALKAVSVVHVFGKISFVIEVRRLALAMSGSPNEEQLRPLKAVLDAMDDPEQKVAEQIKMAPELSPAQSTLLQHLQEAGYHLYDDVWGLKDGFGHNIWVVKRQPTCPLHEGVALYFPMEQHMFVNVPGRLNGAGQLYWRCLQKTVHVRRRWKAVLMVSEEDCLSMSAVLGPKP